MDKIRNEYIRGTAQVGRFGEKTREARLRWFGHVLRQAFSQKWQFFFKNAVINILFTVTSKMTVTHFSRSLVQTPTRNAFPYYFYV